MCLATFDWLNDPPDALSLAPSSARPGRTGAPKAYRTAQKHPQTGSQTRPVSELELERSSLRLFRPEVPVTCEPESGNRRKADGTDAKRDGRRRAQGPVDGKHEEVVRGI